MNGTALEVIVSLLTRDMVPGTSCGSFKAVLTLCSRSPSGDGPSPFGDIIEIDGVRGFAGALLKQC
jgi:hypothetical protein